MTIRDVLVYVDDTPAGRVRAEAAVRLAERHQARIAGVFLRSEFQGSFWAADAVSYAAAIDVGRIVREHDQAVTAASEAARQSFEALAGDRSVASEWLVVNGDTDEALIDLARRFDLTVMPIKARPLLSENVVTAAGVALSCGGPVLALPDAGYPVDLGRRVVVAWKNSRESARALRDAWPLLAAAQEVHIVCVSQDGELSPDSDLQRHFERHGVTAKLIVTTDAAMPPSEALRQQAAILAADLMVMGVYGRPRLSEVIFGGVSGEILARPPAALFLSH
jgi:nucleotide-binding universal stress UspA family protein